MKREMRLVLTFLLVPLVLSFPAITSEAKKKLEPEELIALHLDSIGTAESRAGRFSFRAHGSVKFELVTGTGLLYGSSTFLSGGPKRRMSMVFGIPDYPGEEMAFNGDEVVVGELTPGTRSALGRFLWSFDEIVTEGLFGGTLSADWVLQDVESRNPKLKYEGLKKVDGTKYHTLKYQRRKGWDPSVRVYFDQETYRHCYTIYKVKQGAGMVRNPNASVNNTETWYTLKEAFSEFREVGPLTIPTMWTIEHTLDLGGRRGSVIRFTTAFMEIENNPELDENAFELDLDAY